MAVTTSGTLTQAQYTAIKNDVAANSDMNTLVKPGDGGAGYDQIATLYNLQASPNFTVWKTSVPANEIGDAIDANELVGLTTGKLTQLQTLLFFGPINPSLPNRRSAMDQIFSAASGTLTRPALLALYKRFALRIEKLLATGTGSDASPATLQFEGTISATDIQHALTT